VSVAAEGDGGVAAAWGGGEFGQETAAAAAATTTPSGVGHLLGRSPLGAGTSASAS